MLQDTPHPSTHTCVYLQTPPATGRRESPAKRYWNRTTKASLPISPLPGPLTGSPSSKAAIVTPGTLSSLWPALYRWTWSQRNEVTDSTPLHQHKEILHSPAGILLLVFICHSQASSWDHPARLSHTLPLLAPVQSQPLLRWEGFNCSVFLRWHKKNGSEQIDLKCSKTGCDLKHSFFALRLLDRSKP